MKYIILILMGSFSLSASEFLEAGSKRFNSTKLHKSKWIIDVAANSLQYESKMPEFNGEHAKVEEDKVYNLYGVDLNFGREFVLGGGLSTTVKIGGFYNETKESSSGKAAKDVDIDLSTEKDEYQVYGAEAGLSINYLIETSYINFQPFISAAAGTGTSSFNKEYTFDGIATATPVVPSESYDIEVEEKFNYLKSSIGVNFISGLGLISYLKITRLDISKTERKTKGDNNGTQIDTKEDDLDESVSNYMASIGFGLYF